MDINRLEFSKRCLREQDSLRYAHLGQLSRSHPRTTFPSLITTRLLQLHLQGDLVVSSHGNVIVFTSRLHGLFASLLFTNRFSSTPPSRSLYTISSPIRNFSLTAVSPCVLPIHHRFSGTCSGPRRLGYLPCSRNLCSAIQPSRCFFLVTHNGSSFGSRFGGLAALYVLMNIFRISLNSIHADKSLEFLIRVLRKYI